VTCKSMPADARAGDSAALRLEHAHWPLIAMLVVTQIAAGLFASASVIAFADPQLFTAMRAPLSIAGFVNLQLGLGVSVLHLGRPLGAWRAFLGLRTSWMSREIFAFGAFAGAASGFVASSVWAPIAFLAAPFAHLATVLAIVGVACSAMIYIDTRRAFWRNDLTFTKFFGTALLLGSAGAGALLAWFAPGEAARAFAIAATVIRTALFGWEFSQFQHALADQSNPTHASARTVWQLLRPLVFARGILFAASTASGLFAIGTSGTLSAVVATLSFALTMGSQLIERVIFFTAVIAPRMPGAFARKVL
ncbi:MAG: DmsC/YnfH family molybdoenzyme membrane anchor subunit, partial [Chthoniobacteraceae bacterium]